MSTLSSVPAFQSRPDFVHFFLRLALLSGIIVTLLLLRRPPRDKAGNVVPPGPKGLPLLGCYTYLMKYPELSLHRWAKKYGPIVSFVIGNQRFIVLSDPHVVKDLLITNGTIFSSRKDTFIKARTILKNRGITATGYNDLWRRDRRVAMTMLGPRAVLGYGPVVEREAREMIRTLLIDGKAGAQPITPCRYASRFALNNILTLIYGIRTEAPFDPICNEVLRMSREFMNLTGAVSNLVDFFPILQHLPNVTTSRARKLHEDILKFNRPFVADIKARMERGEHVPDCLAKTLLTAQNTEGLDDLDVVLTCGSLMIGGVETTASIQQWFAALIAGYPEIQEKAHAELDRVCGRDRFPTEDDEKSLPYIRAIAKEITRVHNPLWLGTPHYSTEDFTYRGYWIPKDCVIITNTWTLHHDPTQHSDPYEFKPERYLGDKLSAAESTRLTDPMARDHWSFGAGRRICPGIALAEKEIFLGVVHMLWAFKIETIPGEPIDMNEYDGVSGRSPVPFRVRLTPRDPAVLEVFEL